MARMIRKQVYIEPKHERLLKRLSEARGVPESELIREGIERVTAAPRWTDRTAWKRLERAMRERARLKVPRTARSWTREELYEERMSRYGPPAR